MALRLRPLTALQIAFVEHLFADPKRDAAAAYARAFKCGARAAKINAPKLAALPSVVARLAELDEGKAERLGLTANEIAVELKAVVSADARDLIEYRRGSCRYCHGAGFQFQRTPAEYRRDLAAYMQRELERPEAEARDAMGLKFDPQGGVGFNPTRAAKRDCPECFGQGVGYTYAKDSRHVSRAAARLYAGVRETKDGIEIRLRNVDKSVELMMKNLGMLADKGKDVESAEEKAAAVRALVQALGATTGGSSNGA